MKKSLLALFLAVAVPLYPAALGSDCVSDFLKNISKTENKITDATSKRADDLIEMKKSPPVQYSKYDGGINGQDKLFFHGVPSFVKKLSSDEIKKLGVMRHYSKTSVDNILSSGGLKPGPRCYIVPEAHEAIYYKDINGVFFTTPDFPPESLWMGLTKKDDYVDFIIDPKMGALSLEKGNYIIPTPPSHPEWLLKGYKEYKNTGKIQSGLSKEIIEEIDRVGIGNEVFVPVTIVRYQKNGKTVILRPELLK